MTLEKYLLTRTTETPIGRGLRFQCDLDDGNTQWKTDDEHTVILTDTGDIAEIDGETPED